MDVITYNLAWFVCWFIASVVFGIIKAWNKKVAFGLLFVGAVFFVIATLFVLANAEAIESSYEWYYYIGSIIGGMSTFLGVMTGEQIYENYIMR